MLRYLAETFGAKQNLAADAMIPVSRRRIAGKAQLGGIPIYHLKLRETQKL